MQEIKKIEEKKKQIQGGDGKGITDTFENNQEDG